MATADFSKKMCQQLLLYEDYLASCPPVPFQKEKIIIERDKLMSMISELRLYHCADRQLITGVSATGETLTVKANFDNSEEIAEPCVPCMGTDLESATEPTGLEQDLLQSPELNEKTRTQTMVACEQMVYNAQQQADMILKNARQIEADAKEKVSIMLQEAQREAAAVKEAAQRSLQQSEAAMMEAKAQAQAIVSTAHVDRDVEIDQIHQKARITAESIINEARVQADLMITKAKTDIAQMNSDNEEKQRESFKLAAETAKQNLEEQNRTALELLQKTLQQSEDCLSLVTAVYDQQIGVVKEDRKEIEEIITKLESKWV